MTDEEAFGIIFNMMPEDEDGINALSAAISALRDRIAREKPEPLTLAELRKMDGEPVWCTDINGRFGSWAIVGAYRVESPTEKCRYEYYGQSWLAYRRNPEGSENDG